MLTHEMMVEKCISTRNSNKQRQKVLCDTLNIAVNKDRGEHVLTQEKVVNHDKG